MNTFLFRFFSSFFLLTQFTSAHNVLLVSCFHIFQMNKQTNTLCWCTQYFYDVDDGNICLLLFFDSLVANQNTLFNRNFSHAEMWSWLWLICFGFMMCSHCQNDWPMKKTDVFIYQMISTSVVYWSIHFWFFIIALGKKYICLECIWVHGLNCNSHWK